ncbi:MAG: hypothetical protein IJ608_13045 [Lachnospiraceae bacterium]|nr:hypothetical protein [Lachnospiraceae bacterium]
MQTDKVRVNSNGTGTAPAMDEVERFSEYMGLDRKCAMRLRLIAEETLGMVNAITEDFEADFWLEGERDQACRLHLTAETKMNLSKKRELLDASSDKKNAAYKGFMGRIREMMEEGIYAADEDASSAENVPPVYGRMGVHGAGNSYAYQYSLAKYRADINAAKASSGDKAEEWDELEKSIVANIADDVRVGVRGNTVELVIEKDWSKHNA